MKKRKNNAINIAFITDDNYVIPTAVALTSLIKHTKKSSIYNITIIATALSKENIDKFKSFEDKNIEINIKTVSIDKFNGLHKQSANSFCVASEAALLKFELPNILKNQDKVLYLDGDILVQQDISELFNTDVTEYLCAAAYDTGCLYSQNTKFAKYTKYFNSGVMVLNLSKMRQKNMSQKLFNAKKYSTNFNLMDQDIFNEVFNGSVKIIDIIYNCLIINLIRAQHSLEFAALNRLLYSDYKSFYDLTTKAVILHFSSKDKPWKYTDGMFSDIWYHYFLQSPYAEYNLERVNQKESLNIKQQVIISLTSYPARIKTLNQTVYSLLTQSIKADKVILWLAKEQFPNKEKDLPQELLSLTKIGLEIDWYHDIKSYKKLIPSLKKYPDAIIVTADDDLLYDKNWLENLLVSYTKNPHMLHCHRAHMMNFEKGIVLPYRQWGRNIKQNKTLYNAFPTSGAGVLYPPHSLYKDVLDEEKFMNLCPQADDIWFWAMAVKNDFPIKVVENNISKLNYIDGTQENALWHTNVTGGQNDIQLQNVLKEYPEILDKLDKTITMAPKIKKVAKKAPPKSIISYDLFHFIPLYTYKKRGGNQVWKIFGIPVWRIRKMENTHSVKCYLFGLPFVKICNEIVEPESEYVSLD